MVPLTIIFFDITLFEISKTFGANFLKEQEKITEIVVKGAYYSRLDEPHGKREEQAILNARTIALERLETVFIENSNASDNKLHRGILRNILDKNITFVVLNHDKHEEEHGVQYVAKIKASIDWGIVEQQFSQFNSLLPTFSALNEEIKQLQRTMNNSVLAPPQGSLKLLGENIIQQAEQEKAKVDAFISKLLHDAYKITIGTPESHFIFERPDYVELIFPIDILTNDEFKQTLHAKSTGWETQLKQPLFSESADKDWTLAVVGSTKGLSDYLLSRLELLSLVITFVSNSEISSFCLPNMERLAIHKQNMVPLEGNIYSIPIFTGRRELQLTAMFSKHFAKELQYVYGKLERQRPRAKENIVDCSVRVLPGISVDENSSSIKSKLFSEPFSPESRYLAMVEDAIDQRWTAPALSLKNESVVVKFRIARSGVISQVYIEESSGNSHYDLAARRAVESVNPLPSFPLELQKAFIDVRFRFIKVE